MRARLLGTALIVGIASAIGFSSDKKTADHQRAPEFRVASGGGHEVAEEALRKYYGPTARAHITSEFEVNGVRVFNASVDRDGALADATLTAAGDYISMGIPEPINALTPGAQETAQLFKSAPAWVVREDIHAYYITVKSPGNRPATFEFDATGRVRDIKTAGEIREDAVAQRVGDPVAHRIAVLTDKRFAGIAIEGVFVARNDPGFYMVPFHNQHGKGWAIIAENNDVTEWRYPEPMDKLPEGVRRAIDRELRGDRIINIEQGAGRLYRMVQNVNGEELTMLVTSAGAVDWISSRELHRPNLREFHPR